MLSEFTSFYTLGIESQTSRYDNQNKSLLKLCIVLDTHYVVILSLFLESVVHWIFLHDTLLVLRLMKGMIPHHTEKADKLVLLGK